MMTRRHNQGSSGMNRLARSSALKWLVIAGICLVTAIPSLALARDVRGSQDAVTLTFWSWVPKLQDEVKLFEQAHPNIKVKLVNAGQGTPEYTKLRTALKAGSGAPDVVQVEFQYIPTFTQIKGLVDLAKYGANGIKGDYVPWTWAQVSKGGKVYAIPQDSGPMGLLYRKDIFDRYGINVPRTWAEYAAAAEKLHKANPKIYMTNFNASDGGWNTALLWQAGSRPFSVNGTTVRIKIDDAPALRVANYWEKLVKSRAVQPAPAFTNAWYTGLAKGTYATWVTAAWGPVFLSGVAAKSSGKWRAAPMPQWSPGKQSSSNWGGSTSAVTTQSKHPKEAAELAMWLNHDRRSVHMMATKQFLFPVLKAELNSPPFKNARLKFYGGQQVNKIFIDSSKRIDLTFQWSPFQDYAYSQIQEQLGNAAQGKQSFAQALHKAQANVVKFAKEQGFTVK
jgi:multiple sugar transport system substrate-binding protein